MNIVRSSKGVFLSTLSLRRATWHSWRGAFAPRFLSTLSLRRATDTGGNDNGNAKISIHALLAESDGILPHDARKIIKFLSTLSLRRATCSHVGAWLYKNISIHALLAESDPLDEFQDLAPDISIHALLAESDRYVSHMGSFAKISIHALLAESDRPKRYPAPACMYFYPRSPCGERLVKIRGSVRPDEISIHALLAESDQ